MILAYLTALFSLLGYAVSNGKDDLSLMTWKRTWMEES